MQEWNKVFCENRRWKSIHSSIFGQQLTLFKYVWLNSAFYNITDYTVFIRHLPDYEIFLFLLLSLFFFQEIQWIEVIKIHCTKSNRQLYSLFDYWNKLFHQHICWFLPCVSLIEFLDNQVLNWVTLRISSILRFIWKKE